MKISKNHLKELIKQSIDELKFGSKAQYSKYKSQHDIKPGTTIDIAGKKSKEKAPLKTSKAREKEADKFADAENAKLDAAEKAMKAKKKKKSKKEVKESKGKRFTVKEVRMWMKKLEENRYKKVYNADARRVSWMVNNMGEAIENMPKSMSKKWTKAQYGRERYLSKEFIKHSYNKSLSENKLRNVIKQIIKEELNEAKMVKLILPVKDRKKAVHILQKQLKLKVSKDFEYLGEKGRDFVIELDKKFENEVIELFMKTNIKVRG